MSVECIVFAVTGIVSTAVISALIAATYIHNWSLQPFSQDY